MVSVKYLNTRRLLRRQKNKMSFEEFLDFRKFITVTFMKIIYIVVALIITIAGFWMMVAGSVTPFYGVSIGVSGVIGGILVLTLGNLGWRLFCESIVVIFSIHDRLISIDNKTGSTSKATPIQSQAPPPQNKFCSSCGTKVPSGTKFCSNCGTAVSQ